MNDDINEISLAQCLASKLCHDIAGALSAVSNGIEFLDSDQTKDKAFDLLRHGSEQSIILLEFFRKAYGTSANNGEANLEEVERLCSRLVARHKITLDFHSAYAHQPDVFICIDTGKLIMCFVAIAIESLIYGGVVTVQFTKTDGKKKIVVIASHTKLKNNQQKNLILCDGIDSKNLTHNNAHYFYAYKMSKRLGAKITVNASEKLIEYIVE